MKKYTLAAFAAFGLLVASTTGQAYAQHSDDKKMHGKDKMNGKMSEKEHTAMMVEWIRRRDPVFDKELRDYLFTDKPIAALEPPAWNAGFPLPRTTSVRVSSRKLASLRPHAPVVAS